MDVVGSVAGEWRVDMRCNTLTRSLDGLHAYKE